MLQNLIRVCVFAKKVFSSIIVQLKLPLSRSSITFSFQISTNLPYTYNKTYCTCFSTVAPLIFILIQSLHTLRNPKTLLVSLLNIYGLTTSIFDLILGQGISATTTSPTPPTNNTWICACITVSYLCCCLIICLQFIKLY